MQSIITFTHSSKWNHANDRTLRLNHNRCCRSTSGQAQYVLSYDKWSNIDQVVVSHIHTGEDMCFPCSCYRNGTVDKGLNTQHGVFVCKVEERQYPLNLPLFKFILCHTINVIEIVTISIILFCSFFFKKKLQEPCHQSLFGHHFNLSLTFYFYSTLFHSPHPGVDTC